MKTTMAGAFSLLVGAAFSKSGCSNGRVGVGTQQFCDIVNMYDTECSQIAGTIYAEGSCNTADTENMYQASGYCQPITMIHGAKVFCESDGSTVTSVAYNLAIWGNCEKVNIDCSSGAEEFESILYCCEKIQG